MDLTAIVAILSVFGSVSFLVWVIVDGLRRKRQLQVVSEFHNKLIERMGNSRELSEFLETPGGTRFIESIAMERVHPGLRVLRAVQIGIVLCAAGIGCRVIGAQAALFRDTEALSGFIVLGILLLSVGIGYLVSAVASFVLSRSLGMYSSPAEPVR